MQARARFFLRWRQTPDERLRTYLGTTLTSRAAATEVRTFDLAPWLLERWDGVWWKIANPKFRLGRAQSLGRVGLQSLSETGLVAGLGVAAWSVVSGRLVPGASADSRAWVEGC